MNGLLTKLERLIDLMIAHYEGGAVAPEPKPKKAKKEPEAAAAPLPPAAPIPPAAPLPPAAPEMTDKESYDELCRLAIAYIAGDKPGHESRRDVAMKHVEATYRVSALSGVPHGPQRLQLIGWFKSQRPQVAAAPASGPAGFGV